MRSVTASAFWRRLRPCLWKEVRPPPDAVAKRAGVWITSLSRRFPTREDLLAAY
ncbi:TetR family transcriptional regulator [Rhizobium sp. 268]